MARTALFTALRRLFHAQQSELGLPARSSRRFVSRRSFAAGALSASALRALPGSALATVGCAGDGPPASTPKPPAVVRPRVVVVGAGIAGLHAAYRLHQADVDVTVYEASDRAGGRMFTGRGQFADEQVCELGGELIDTNHRFMFALAEEFGLSLDDRSAGAPEGYVADTWFVLGKVVTEQTVIEQFKQVGPQMAADMQAADLDEERYAELDSTSLEDYLNQVCPTESFAELNAILSAAYLGEFGLETREQSALNLIYLIDGATPEPFRIFGDSDERYHIHGGNDQVPLALAKKLGSRVVLEHRLVVAARTSSGYKLTFERADGTRHAELCDRVVFALPFSTLRLVDLGKLGLSEEKTAIIQTLGYGTNTKVMGGFSSRVWRSAHNSSGSITSDAAFQQTWDSSIGQLGESGILTNFLGGRRAWPPEKASLRRGSKRSSRLWSWCFLG
jgi:monoamine oxidase